MGLWDTLFPQNICEGCRQPISNGKNSMEMIELIDRVKNEEFLYFSIYGIIVNYIYKNIDIEDRILNIIEMAINESYRLTGPINMFSQDSKDAQLRREVQYIPTLCNNCFERNFKEFKSRYNNAYAKMNTVQTYPANYSGKFNLDNSVTPQIVTYRMEKGKNQTINKIKFMAAFHNRDIVYNITYNYDKDTCTGVYAKKSIKS